MLKEKLIFWALLFIFFLGLGVGVSTLTNKRDAAQELIRDIESSQITSKKTLKLKREYDLDTLKQSPDFKMYEGLIKKSPFFRLSPDEIPRKIVEVVKQIVEEEPKKILFKYKGRVQMGTRQTVIIEEQLTKKSYFVSMGDKIGDYEVFEIGPDRIILKREGSEDIVLEAKEERQ